jgi:L-threonylcarbamoyladenylate synthase
MIHLASLRAALERSGLEIEDGALGTGAAGPLRSPGRLLKHYSPKAKLQILSWRDEEELRAKISGKKMPLAKTHVIAHTVIPGGGGFARVSVIPHDAEAFARAIYAELHESDEAGAGWIVVEALPDTDEWRAIADRLKRAAA